MAKKKALFPESEIIFTPESEIDTEFEDYRDAYDRSLSELEVRGISWILDKRPQVLRFFQILLVGQNLLVFALVFAALFTNKLDDLQIIFSVLVAGTLTETAFAIKFIVQFLFPKPPAKTGKKPPQS